MYVPLRRAFIKPISNYYVSNRKVKDPETLEEEATQMSVNDVLKEISQESKGLFHEFKPRTANERNTFVFDSKIILQIYLLWLKYSIYNFISFST